MPVTINSRRDGVPDYCSATALPMGGGSLIAAIKGELWQRAHHSGYQRVAKRPACCPRGWVWCGEGIDGHRNARTVYHGGLLRQTDLPRHRSADVPMTAGGAPAGGTWTLGRVVSRLQELKGSEENAGSHLGRGIESVHPGGVIRLAPRLRGRARANHSGPDRPETGRGDGRAPAQCGGFERRNTLA